MVTVEELVVLTERLGGLDGLDDSRARLRDLLATARDPTDRDCFAPGHVTASAFVVDPGLERVLLVHHDKLDRWVQPGGHVEITDIDHQSAARREVAEECGITDLTTLGVVDLDIHDFPRRGETPAHLHFDLRWAFRSHHHLIGAGDGVRGVRWASFDEATTMEESIARPVRRLIDWLSIVSPAHW